MECPARVAHRRKARRVAHSVMNVVMAFLGRCGVACLQFIIFRQRFPQQPSGRDASNVGGPIEFVFGLQKIANKSSCFEVERRFAFVSCYLYVIHFQIRYYSFF